MSTTAEKIAEKIAELKDNILTLEAFERGETVQWFSDDLCKWKDDLDPVYTLMSNIKIRIKPKPREWWISEGSSSGHFYVCSTEGSADVFGDAIHVREVIEP